MIAALTKCPATIYPEFDHFPWQKLTRSIFIGQVSWRILVEDHQYTRYDYHNREYVKVKDTKKLLKLNIEDKKKTNGLKSIINKFILLQEEHEVKELLVYQNLALNSNYLFVEHNDVKRFFSLLPNNPEPLLALVISKALTYSTFWEEGGKKLTIATPEALLELWSGFGKIAHLLMATSMICSDKTARTIAVEIWIKGVSENIIHSDWIGSIIGEQKKIEFAPLKRLTDLIISNMNMLFISDQHNKALEKMLVESSYPKNSSKT